MLPLKELKLPPIDPMSPTAKPVTFSLAVNVRIIFASLVIELFATVLEPSEAVMVMIGSSESSWPLACAPWNVGNAIWGLKPVIDTNAHAKNENVIAFFTLVEAFFWFDENLLR